jgi:hypothetical protein
MKTMKYGVNTDFSHQTKSTGVTQLGHLELPKVTPESVGW